MRKIKPYLISSALALAVGGLGALLTAGNMDLYREVNTPPLSPPSFLFPVVWSILYVLMGIGAAVVYQSRPSGYLNADRALGLYAVNLIVNFVWSLIFFNARAFLFSFIWLILLWLVILLMIRAFYSVNRTAARLQIPYLLWVTFAGYLNLSIYLLN